MASAPTISYTVARYMDDAGIRRRRIVQITGPVSYPTGGFSFAASLVNCGALELAPNLLLSSGTAVRLAVYDYTNSKYLVFVPNTGAEVANGTDLSSFSTRSEFVGT